MSEATSNTEQRERLERELGDQLVTLGEAPPSEAELVLLRGLADDSDSDTNPTSSTNLDIATVARLAELAEPIAFEDLSELELHRAWRGVANINRFFYSIPSQMRGDVIHKFLCVYPRPPQVPDPLDKHRQRQH